MMTISKERDYQGKCTRIANADVYGKFLLSHCYLNLKSNVR